MTDSQHLVDITEAQRLTGLDKNTLYKLARTGRVRSFKVLSALRFLKSDLTSLVVERTPSGDEHRLVHT